jgi:hypothetical protein
MGGSSNSAADAANYAEQARQASIARTQGRVNQVFNSPQRQADINDFVNATRSYYQQDLNRQKGNADRGLKFALAKSGLTGGSTQVDQQRVLGDDYGRGLLQVESKAQGAGASLSAADQDARSRLISLATSGLDATTAAQQASAAMRSNLQAGQSEAQMGSLGDSFAQFNAFKQQADTAANQRRGYYSTFGGKNAALYGGGNTGYGGGGN